MEGALLKARTRERLKAKQGLCQDQFSLHSFILRGKTIEKRKWKAGEERIRISEPAPHAANDIQEEEDLWWSFRRTAHDNIQQDCRLYIFSQRPKSKSKKKNTSPSEFARILSLRRSADPATAKGYKSSGQFSNLKDMIQFTQHADNTQKAALGTELLLAWSRKLQ